MSRYSKNESPLRELLVKHITSATFLPDSHESGTIIRKKAFFADLKSLQGNLSFKQSTLKKLLKEVATDTTSWPRPLKPEEHDDWAATMATRIRSCCRFCSQAFLKNPPPKWTKSVFGEVGKMTKKRRTTEKEKEAEEEEEKKHQENNEGGNAEGEEEEEEGEQEEE